MKIDPVIITHPRYSILGAISICIVGLVISLTLFYTGSIYPSIRMYMFLDVVLVWLLVIGCIIMDRQIRILQTTVTALTQYIKVKNHVR